MSNRPRFPCLSHATLHGTSITAAMAKACVATAAPGPTVMHFVRVADHPGVGESGHARAFTRTNLLRDLEEFSGPPRMAKRAGPPSKTTT